uniref:2OG-Fe(II) oxygenase n=1 Tax=Haptolina brevifila TaxID=156173 RepID=A0A7S2N8S1_9EUKA
MVPVPARWTHGMGEHIRVQAVPGLFVLFPAWLQHYVPAHAGSRPRISISFNVRLTFPDDTEAGTTEEDIGHVGAAAFEGATARLPELSFTVPLHHQRDFLDASVAKDMRVS